jgi:hypothetical protein
VRRAQSDRFSPRVSRGVTGCHGSSRCFNDFARSFWFDALAFRVCYPTGWPRCAGALGSVRPMRFFPTAASVHQPPESRMNRHELPGSSRVVSSTNMQRIWNLVHAIHRNSENLQAEFLIQSTDHTGYAQLFMAHPDGLVFTGQVSPEVCWNKQLTSRRQCVHRRGGSAT